MAAFKLSYELKTLTFVYNTIFVKIFKTTKIKIIEQCQYFCEILPCWAFYELTRLVFLITVNKDVGSVKCLLSSQYDVLEFNLLCEKFNIDANDSVGSIKHKIWKYVENHVKTNATHL